MSVDATRAVYARSTMTGAAFAVHLAIADTVNSKNDLTFWMDLDRLAEKARITRRSVTNALATLVEAGYLEELTARGRGKRNPRFRLVLDPPQMETDDAEMESRDVSRGSDTSIESQRKQRGPNGAAEVDLPAPSSRQVAEALVNEWWEERRDQGRPVSQRWIACVKIVEGLHSRGESIAALRFGLRDTLVVSEAAMVLSIERERRRRAGVGQGVQSGSARDAARRIPGGEEALNAALSKIITDHGPSRPAIESSAR